MTNWQAGDSHVLEAEKVLPFILAGNATFTLQSLNPKPGSPGRYTFRVKFKESEQYGDGWFVSLLSGSNNESDYTYLGKVKNGSWGFPKFTLTPKSKMTMDSRPVRAFTWILDRLVGGKPIDGVEVWHTGHCGRCGRLLTVPESVEQGYGPECIKNLL